MTSTETGLLPILQLQHLLDRSHAADAPDRQLDVDVYLAVTSSASTAIRHPELAGWVTWPDADSLDLDLEVPRYTASIDAMAELVRTALPGFWWTCGFCELTNDASIYPHGTTMASMGTDFRQGDRLKLLDHPVMGRIFDDGFHCDRRGGTVALSLLAAFIEAKMAVAKATRTAPPEAS